MAAAHHKSLVSSVAVHSLTRIKYGWSEIIEQLRFHNRQQIRRKKVKVEKSRWQLSTKVKRKA